MKKHSLATVVLLLLVALSVSLNSCKKIETGLSSIVWQINFDLVTTTWDIQFIDAATGLPIEAGEEDQVEVTVSGTDQVNILDLAGIRQPIFRSSHGFLALALHPDRQSPEAATPVRFTIHAAHPTYLPVNVPVLTYRDGINPIRVYLVSRNSAPLNVDMLVQKQAGPLVMGRLTDSLLLYTSANLASIRMDAGTEIKAASGAQLAGNLTMEFCYWEGGTTNGLKALPGGQVTVNESGNPGLVYLACGIFTEIRDQDGKTAKTISDPISCTALISKTVYNPSTKIRLTAGESIPLWYMNPESGIWESLGTTVLQAFQNKLTASFAMDQPGLYMAGWINENLCPSPLLLHPNALPEYNLLPYSFNMNIFEVYGDEMRFVRSAGINGLVNEDFELRFLPDNSELVFRFEPYTAADNPYYRSPDPILLSGFCESGGPAEFDLLPKPNSSYRQIEVVFIDVEHNNTRYNPKVFPGLYRKAGTSSWQSAFVYGGNSYLINPVVGEKYEMGINFKGKFHLKEVVVGEEEVVLVEIAID